MIHFSCDRCRRTIDEEELRFSVSIEIQVALEGHPFEIDETPADESELDVLHEVLSQFDEHEREEISQFAYQRNQYDLCPECHNEFVKNPLGGDSRARVGFSQN